MKVLLLRADSLRHKALSARLDGAGFLTGEIVESKANPLQHIESKLLRRHFTAREQSEHDFFHGTNLGNELLPKIHIESGAINSIQVLEFVNSFDFDLTITFGVSILRDELIHKLNNSIMGIHLGLSPYYRGSGTNFFPFVNSELAAIGYTLMHLNSQIDKGPIIHQGRAPIVIGDSIHTIGNRNIKFMFEDIIALLQCGVNLHESREPKEINSKFYSRKDFSVESLIEANTNLNSGLVSRHLDNYEFEVERFPIILHPTIKGSKA